MASTSALDNNRMPSGSQVTFSAPTLVAKASAFCLPVRWRAPILLAKAFALSAAVCFGVRAPFGAMVHLSRLRVRHHRLHLFGWACAPDRAVRAAHARLRFFFLQ